MMNGWVAPAVGIFIVTQAAAAVWWASGTEVKVGNNTTAIEQVIENEKTHCCYSSSTGRDRQRC